VRPAVTRRIGATVALVALCSVALYAALARSTTLSGNNGATAGTTTQSMTNFTVSGADKVLYCSVGSGETTVTSPDPTVIWDSAGANQSFTKISQSTGTGQNLFLYRLIAPTDGVNKTISFSGQSATARDAAICVLYTGVDQVTPNDAVDLREVTATANPASNSVTGGGAGDWLVGFTMRSGATVPGLDTSTGGAIITTQGTSGTTAIFGFAEDQDGATDTIKWTSGSGSTWTLQTFNLNASGAPAATPCYGSLLGVGCEPLAELGAWLGVSRLGIQGHDQPVEDERQHDGYLIEQSQGPHGLGYSRAIRRAQQVP
jgi:hypothetical protein